MQITRSSIDTQKGPAAAWHTHPHGQTIVVIEGVGLCQRQGGPIEENGTDEQYGGGRSA